MECGNDTDVHVGINGVLQGLYFGRVVVRGRRLCLLLRLCGLSLSGSSSDHVRDEAKETQSRSGRTMMVEDKAVVG